MVSGKMNGMTVRIDKAGRLVLPKPLRDRLGLVPGADLELSEGPDGLLLKPAQQRLSLIREGDLLVHLGRLPRDYAWNRLIDDSREERIRDLSRS
jgi:AbrB family looped-hinge helix DNA binding protein